MRVKGKKASKNSFRIFGTLGLILAGVLGGILFSSQEYYSHFIEWYHRKEKKEVQPKIIKPAEVINIRISQEKLQDIKVLGKNALKGRILRPEHSIYFDAKIEFKGDFIPIKMRLKGDWVDHLQSDKWSYRVKVKDGNTLLGMRSFSLQHPRTRAYLEEWFSHQLLRQEGVISLRYNFVKVFINGTYKGIYAMEEHFDKRLIENNQRREGPILKFSEDLLWDKRMMGLGDARSLTDGFHESHVTGFETGKTYKDSSMVKLYEKAVSLLSGFKQGILPAEEVFDIELLAKYWAILDLTEGSHGAIWHNLRFYYNPITSRLEPIAFDMSSFNSSPKTEREILLNTPEPLNDLLIKNPSFLKAYLKHLQRVGKFQYFDKFWFAIHADYENELGILSKEYEGIKLNKRKFRHRQEVIQHILGSTDGIQTGIAINQEGKWQLQLSNMRLVPFELLSVENHKGKKIDFPKGDQKIILAPAKNMHQNWSLEVVDWPSENRPKSKSGWKINYKILGLHNPFQTEIQPAPLLASFHNLLDALRKKENASEFTFIRKDEKYQTCFIPEGKHTIDSDLICPKDFTLSIASGAQITLRRNANIIVQGALIINGSHTNPVIIESLGGQGIFVQQAGKESLLKNVIFKNLRNPKKQDWELPGGLTFHEGTVSINECSFSQNFSEDALNLIRCTFILENLYFSDIWADAIDGDFTNGAIQNCHFKNINNDAIDVSGSNLSIANCTISQVADKAISAGENSNMNIRNINIDSSAIGIAAKDLSRIEGIDIQINNVEVAYTAFQKKSEFGTASISIKKGKMEKVLNPYLIEKGSNFSLNGKDISPNADTVKLMMYGNKYGKKSK